MSRNSSIFGRLAAAVAAAAAVVLAGLGAAPAGAVPGTTPTLAVIGSVTAPNGGDTFATVPNMAVDAAHHALYALEEGGSHSSLAVIDSATRTVTSSVALPHIPNGVSIDAARGFVYVTVSDINAGTSALWVISSSTKAHVATIPLGVFQVVGASGNAGIAVDPSTGSVYVPGGLLQGGTSVPSLQVLTAAQISTAVGGTTVTPTVISLPSTTQGARAVAVDSAAGIVYAVGEGLSGSSLYAISAASNAVTATIPLSGLPNNLTVDSASGTVYVSQRTPAGYALAAVPRGAAAATATIALPAGGESLEVDPNLGTLFVAISQPFEGGTVNELLAISTASRAIVASSPLPTPAGLALDTTTGTAFVSGAMAGNTTIAALRLFGVARVAGGDRYATSVAVSQRAFPGTAPVVYIASGANYPDALAAGPAAAKRGGPLLLSAPYALPGDVAAEVKRLTPATIVVVGGPASVSDDVLAQLRAIAPGATIARAAGDDRFATSRTVVAGAFTTAGTVYLASGSNFPDALAAGGAAGAQGAPILLVDGAASSVDAATASLLSTLKAKNVELVGGTAAVSAGIATSLTHAGYTVARLAGSDRYATAQAVNEHAYTHASTAVLATGFGFPDALSATTWAATTSSPLYLAPGSCVPRGVLADLGRLRIGTVTLIGGPAVLTASTAALTPCVG
ncbi:cell wall-binding repeat-containing protein [Leifsonia sp. fls2-241-R2A-40a]|uniref:cell wall-binding repeat-containing protein n=1 Tax=Leifsonia sp. fls2-241-R2A-40a TaxID=3040290 RepID=UPI00254B75D8|nr:cell wall-binding repeat-containing protein [Leifsonia sp. fls2-241-R2A-40a]